MSFDDDDEEEEVARARFDRLAELLNIVRANTKDLHKIAADIREDTARPSDKPPREHL